MAHSNLTDRAVRAVSEPGTHTDGGERGLYLRVAKGGSKSWLLRYQRDGRRRELGLGGYPTVSLAEAREKAADARRKVKAGTDPIDAKRAERARAEIDAAKTTFKDAAIRYIGAHKAGWRNPKHRAQWSSSLENYVFPRFGAV